MKLQQFLEHHGIARNPFAEEDAQSDQVFKEHCITDAYHPAWDKIFGDPGEPATSVVFGEKGAGKTAMGLQIGRHLETFNEQNPNRRLFVIKYDDFNPFIDRFVNRMPPRRKRIDRALSNWQLWDHMDAILSLGVTDLVSRVLKKDETVMPKLADLDIHQRRDLLLLSACYDQSTEQPYVHRWKQLRRRLRCFSIKTKVPVVIGVVVTAAVIYAAVSIFAFAGENETLLSLRDRIPLWAYLLVALLGWLPWLVKATMRLWTALGVSYCLRVISRPILPLWRLLMKFKGSELADQPMPNQDRSDDRYELLSKFQAILETLGFGGAYVLVDRVDEPHLVNGSADLMKALIWPMLDNKFLKHQGLGIKLLLPAELKYFVEREGREFSQRARLDKQNMVPSLAWTGEALFDVANARLRACAVNGKTPNIRDIFDAGITDDRLLDSFRSLRVPRHLHKFFYQLLVSHCNAHTDENPKWQIDKERFESELKLYERDMIEART